MRESDWLSRRKILLLASTAAVQGWLPLDGGDSGFWNKKDPAEWTAEEIHKLTTDSPWAKPVTAVSGNEGGGVPATGGGRMGGVGFPGGGGSDVTFLAQGAFSQRREEFPTNSMKTFSALLTTAALAATLAFAQHNGGPPNPAQRVQHRVNFLTTLLSLTTAQQQQATTIFTGAASTEASLHANMKTAHEGLGDAVKTNNSATIEQFSTTIGNLTAQMVANQAKADAAFYLILTPDQQTKFSQFESENHGHGQWGMGHGRPN